MTCLGILDNEGIKHFRCDCHESKKITTSGLGCTKLVECFAKGLSELVHQVHVQQNSVKHGHRHLDSSRLDAAEVSDVSDAGHRTPVSIVLTVDSAVPFSDAPAQLQTCRPDCSRSAIFTELISTAALRVTIGWADITIEESMASCVSIYYNQGDSIHTVRLSIKFY
jgi:hypothetical protein